MLGPQASSPASVLPQNASSKTPCTHLRCIVCCRCSLLASVSGPINPAAWTPPSAPTLTGVYAANNRLASTQRLLLGDGRNPEDVALDAEGRILRALKMDEIIQLQPDGTKPVVFPNTG